MSVAMWSQLPDRYCPACGRYHYDDHPFVASDDSWDDTPLWLCVGCWKKTQSMTEEKVA